MRTGRPQGSNERPPATADVRRKARRRGLLVVFLVSLSLSHAVRWWRGDPPVPGRPAIEVAAIDGDSFRPQEPAVRLAYRDWAGPHPDAPVLVALHGSPGSSGDFDSLAPRLAERYRVVAPDLPGFGGSSRRAPDYGIGSHAGYTLALLDHLGIARADLLGFSMGGGVAITLADQQPTRFRSLTLLSAIGVQELELLGSYHANHSLHALQLGGLWVLRTAVPHFGVLDRFPLNVPYARNFYDTDQRPLRAALRRLEMPLLIVHGTEDPLVPWAAAQEHHRLVPQSELVSWPSGHFLVFQESDRLAPPMLDFLGRVDDGTATDRTGAAADRVAAADADRGGPPPRARGLGLVVVGVLLAFATMASEDLTCITAGLLAAQGRIPFTVAALACFAGIFVGDLLLYAAGRWLGPPGLRRRPMRWLVRSDDVERSRKWFVERGGIVIFLSRFLPGTRIPTYVAAGVLDMPVLWFASRLFVPVALWTPLLVGAAMLIGERLLPHFETFSRWAALGLVGMMIAIWGTLIFARTVASRRGRRLLVGRWRRWARWEYWPIWAIYPPIVLYILWLGVRFRGLTLFTAVNPGIPSGGFAGESKRDILARFPEDAVPPYRSIATEKPIEEQTRAVREFLVELGLDYPVVLKPDTGERGSGVAVVQDEEQVATYFETAAQDTIVQAYVDGPELGVFYVRRPGADRGWIFSTTEKVLPEVVGDGRRNLEALILDDPRAVVLASVYLPRFATSLERVPAPGEPVRLGVLGVHSRGALFRDGAAFATPALEAEVDRISQAFDGFYFGRFDLRAPSLEHFRRGEGLQVLELNGVTAEATHIYDPSNSLWNAYKVLFAQWRLAFEIGAENRARGAEPMSIGALLRLIRDYRRESS